MAAVLPVVVLNRQAVVAVALLVAVVEASGLTFPPSRATPAAECHSFGAGVSIRGPRFAVGASLTAVVAAEVMTAPNTSFLVRVRTEMRRLAGFGYTFPDALQGFIWPAGNYILLDETGVAPLASAATVFQFLWRNQDAAAVTTPQDRLNFHNARLTAGQAPHYTYLVMLFEAAGFGRVDYQHNVADSYLAYACGAYLRAGTLYF